MQQQQQQQVLGLIPQHYSVPRSLGQGSVAALVAVGSVLLVLGTQAVALRFWARSRTNARLLLDDWLTVPAWMSFVASTALIFYCISLGSMGYSHGDRSPKEMADTAKPSAQAEISMNMLSIVCFGCAKASALLFYRRVFCAGGKHPALNKTILVAAPVVGLWTVVFVLMTVFQCGLHFSAGWDGTKLKYCNWSYPSIEGMAASDVLLDLFVIALPIYPITKLATTQKNKIAIGGVFLIALVGLTASITRFIMVENVARLGREYVNHDLEYYMSKMAFYWILEMGVSVVVVNLAPIWTALDSLRPNARLPHSYASLEDDEEGS